MSRKPTRAAPSRGRHPAPARFKVGDRVRARNIHPPSHTRLPRFVRGHVGIVEIVHGAHVYPMLPCLSGGSSRNGSTTVKFDHTEIWGPDGDPNVEISVDAFEPYLEPAS